MLYFCEYCAKEMLTPVVVWDDELVFCSSECRLLFFKETVNGMRDDA